METIEEQLSPEELRELGISYFRNSNGDEEIRRNGLRMLLRAKAMGDVEATYLVAKLLLDGVISYNSPDPESFALDMMCDAANSGSLRARAHLNAYCQWRYKKEFSGRPKVTEGGPLVDFSGKTIKLNRKGLFTPVDAVLTYENGVNLLTIRTNLSFIYTDDIPSPEKFEAAVRRGLRLWEGMYTVFCGQKLKVKVELTEEDNLYDNLYVIPVTDYMGKFLRTVGTALATRERKAQIEEALDHKRSFASNGIKWTVNSRKVIYIQSEREGFDDYDELTAVACHEFGHALGLGDLYESRVDSLPGVAKGTYAELDSYAVTEKFYNLVMCDHHGPISNNDLEMVILAFLENKMQHFQPGMIKGKISKALGRGN
ncbi:MAG: hypothetical protein IKU07_05140 [Oscillospiraceae bacterium]|nr:hypothetical protein [Oscillospiraceae bacterium]